jgi:molecular chaperone DnaK
MSVIGIDLGTTYSAVAALDDRGRPVTLPNRDGEMLTPSAVLLLDPDMAVVGQAALDVAQEHPDRVATLIKRRMGYSDYGRAVAGRSFRPETLSAIILRQLSLDAAAHVGPIDGVVITVPAYFDDTRRRATQDAGRIAGLNVIDILDEPSAAALAYSFRPNETQKNQTVLVYDLGGGTFDVTLVKLTPKRFQVLGVEGDVRLGGRDWDDRLAEFVAKRFAEKFGEDPRNDEQTKVGLYAACERAKRTLSKVEQASITCNHDGRKLTVPISRTEFETLTRDLLTRTRLTTTSVLRQANLTWDKVDRVLLVGGSTHMPMCRKMLKEVSGKDPDTSLAVSEVVARGAAIHAGIASAKKANSGMTAEARQALENVIEISVIAHSLGVEVRSEREKISDVLIAKNTQLPASASRIYRTVSEGQSRVRVRLLQGEATQADACIPVGECWIEEIPAHLPKGSPVEVTCSVSANGLIHVTAIDQTTGKSVRAEFHRAGGLSEEEIERERKWVQSLKLAGA